MGLNIVFLVTPRASFGNNEQDSDLKIREIPKLKKQKGLKYNLKLNFY